MEELIELPNPALVDLRDHLDVPSFGIADKVQSYAILGGGYPSGSIKDAGLVRILEKSLVARRYRPGQALAELSNGSMARSAAFVAHELGVECFVAFPGSSQDHVNRICERHKAKHLEVDAALCEEGHPLVRYFAVFEESCKAHGLFFSDQTRNPEFRAAYGTLARPLLVMLDEQKREKKVTHIVGSVGTGSTLLGLAEGIALATSVRPHVVGVEPALKPVSASVPWEDIPGLRNTRAFHWSEFGKNDTYDARLVDQRLEVSRNEALSQASLLERGGIRGGLSMGATLSAFIEAARGEKEGCFVLVFSDATAD